MENKIRNKITRAELIAEREKIDKQLDNAWPEDGDRFYCAGTVTQTDDNRAYVVFDGDRDTFQVDYTAMIPVDAMIPREEHEWALAEANVERDLNVKSRSAFNADVETPRPIDIDSAVVGLVTHFKQGEIGHTKLSMPLSDDTGDYRVTVERVEGDVARATKTVVAQQPTSNPCELAVAPVGVVDEIRRLALAVGNARTKRVAEDTEEALNAALAHITVLPEPSDSIQIENGVKAWSRIPLCNGFCVAIRTQDEALELAANAVRAAALLESEGDRD